jgi:zinc protease
MITKKILSSIIAFACFCLIPFTHLNAQSKITPPQKLSTVESVTEYKLANGLQVLLVPDASISNVVVNIVYHVGSRMEGYGETGMAHLLEHMMFKGSKKFTSIKQTIADKGAFANGTTWYDRTDYFEILPASDSNLRWSLEMESDRMVNSLMKKEDLQKEFSVVRNEFEAGENYPDRVLQERILATMYLWHNYGKSTIGSKEDIERVPIENLKQFYQKFYQPDNATLIVGGKFDDKKTLQWINELFGSIPKPKRIIQPDYTVEPVQDGERYVELKRDGDMQYIGVGYHTIAFADKDYAANDALIEILTNNPSGLLYKALIETKLATKVNGYSQPLHDPGYTYFSCDVSKDKNIDSAKNAFLSTLDAIRNTTITQEQLDRAKNTLIKNTNDINTNTIRFCINLAEIIGAGDWRLDFVYRDRVEKLTLADVQAVAKKYYLSSNRTYGIFTPDKNPQRANLPSAVDVAGLVKDYKGNVVQKQAATFDPTIENIKKNTVYGKLSNCFKYALLKKPAKGDKILASIVLRFGNENSLTKKGSIPSLTADMLMTGTTTRSKKDINDALDKLKTSIYIGGAGGSMSININSDKKNIDSALMILSDILLHPLFDKNEFDKMILDKKGELESRKSDPQFIAFNTLSRKTSSYPKGHPLYPRNVDESIEDLKNVSVEDLKNFYQSFYGSNNGVGSFVGDFNVETAKHFLENTFNAFNSKSDYKEIEEKHFATTGSIETVLTPDKKNAVLAGGINIQLKLTDADYPALEMANEMLGGGAFLSSRIPQRLRENEGMSYGAGSFLSVNYKYAASSWGVYAIFNPLFKNRLDSALHEEIAKAIKDGFKDDELKKSVASWLQQRKTYLGLDNFVVNNLTSYLADDRDLSQATELENKVKALTTKEVNEVLRKYIDPNKIVLIYAGDFK